MQKLLYQEHKVVTDVTGAGLTGADASVLVLTNVDNNINRNITFNGYFFAVKARSWWEVYKI